MLILIVLITTLKKNSIAARSMSESIDAFFAIFEHKEKGHFEPSVSITWRIFNYFRKRKVSRNLKSFYNLLLINA